jgi:hypothetical protein
MPLRSGIAPQTGFSVVRVISSSVLLNQLIIEYVSVCEKRGKELDVDDFIVLWLAAHRRAKELAREEVKARHRVERGNN